ncbi:MAG: U32 family peptidase [Anaeroplasma bactoclasticum]|nr:U32 family peptidase [Anaeroplasma bactoclasticum]
MQKIELLAPAGNLEKAKIALEYGADAVYIGGKAFSLRARASNFDLQDIEALCIFAHKRHKKVYVTTNILPHDEDMEGLDTYLLELGRAKVDAIITSSLTIILRAKQLIPQVERHISTQMSVTNHQTLLFYQQLGCHRVVLAREVSLTEMEQIARYHVTELEVFIHGGMCSSYSGRCVLSNHLTNRDANRGGCAHSCRWNYHLLKKGKPLEEKEVFFNMGSKDLMAIRFIPQLIDMGIASLKIEGRMKSAYYLATVVRCYRMLIDQYIEKGRLEDSDYFYFEKEIAKAENRLTATGFLKGDVTVQEQLYDTRTESPTKEYIGYVLDYQPDTHRALIEQRNYFKLGDLVEFFGPKLENTTCTIINIVDATTNEILDVARHPMQQLYISVPFCVQKGDMMRLVK